MLKKNRMSNLLLRKKQSNRYAIEWTSATQAGNITLEPMILEKTNGM